MKKTIGVIFLAVLVLVLGLGVGYIGGNYIVSKKYIINPYEQLDPSQLFDDVSLINYKNKTPDQLTGTEVFVVANYLYDNAEKWTNICTGKITTSIGISQDSYQINMKNGNYYKSEITTIGAFMSSAKKIEYTKGEKLKITPGEANKSNIKATVWGDSYEEMSLEEFMELTGSSPYENSSCIISSKTVIEQSDCKIENDTYTYVLNLDITKATIKYAKQISFFSNIKTLPKFIGIEMTFSVDKNYNLKNIHKVESYIINYSGINVTVNSVIDNAF